MKKFFTSAVVATSVLLTLESFLTNATVMAQPNNPVPSGFKPIASGTGVVVYKKEYPGCSNCKPDYVTVVDLRNATVRNLTGNVNGEQINRQNQSQFWNQAVGGNTSTRNAIAVVNGTFFADRRPDESIIDPTTLAFGLKKDGQLISYGYENRNDRMHLAWKGGGSILAVQPWNQAVFNDPNVPDVVGGLREDADKCASGVNGYDKRTFVGTRETNGDSLNDTMLIYASEYARCTDAASILRGFGANGVMMLDGGGSTFLVVNGQNQIGTGRTVPHALAVYSGQ